jgi:hypothetical protein
MARVQDAVNVKLGLWQDALVRDLSQAPDEFSFGRAMVHARGGIQALVAMVTLPQLPEELRVKLRQQVEMVVTSAQEQLEDGAHRNLCHGLADVAEIQLRQLRGSPLTGALRSAPQTSPAPTPSLTSIESTRPPSLRRRQIIVDQPEVT